MCPVFPSSRSYDQQLRTINFVKRNFLLIPKVRKLRPSSRIKGVERCDKSIKRLCLKQDEEDIDTIRDLAKESLLSFHPGKCELLRVPNRRSPFKGVYRMDDNILNEGNVKNILGCNCNPS